MNCKDCKFFKLKYKNTGRGYCRLWKEYMKEYESCEDWEEE
jgi:hypothetical protein